MSVNADNINTGGAVVTVGGTVKAVDGDGFYWGTVSGVDIGCTSGGVNVAYSYEKNDIYCDQTLAAVDTSISSESAEVTFTMLESDVTNLQYAIANSTYLLNAGTEEKLAIGGLTTLTYIPLQLESTDDQTGLITTWTFFRVLSNSMTINFERENPTGIAVTFTAYADTTHAVGHQLFSVREALA